MWMDIHKKSWSISILADNLEHKTFTQPPHVEVLVNYLKRNFPGGTYKSVYEAGYCGFWIHDRLQEHGVQCLVVNPADVPTKDKERRSKTDRVDCRKLARSLRSGEIDSIYVPSRPKVEDRSLLRTRQSMIRKQMRCKNQIKSILHFYGIQVPEELANGHWSKRFVSWVDAIRMERASGNVALKVHLEELNNMRKIIADLTRSIRNLAVSEEYRQNVYLLKTVPGISTLTAMILLTELYELNRFKNLDKLCSYIGLIHDTDCSGETERKTGITKRRNAQLRGILIESAWVAVRKDPCSADDVYYTVQENAKDECNRPDRQEIIKPYPACPKDSTGIRTGYCSIECDYRVKEHIFKHVYCGYRVFTSTAH